MEHHSQIIITFETAIKMTPYCSEWPTLCWLCLKAYGIFKYLFLDSNPLIWISFGILALTLMLYKYVKIHRDFKGLEEEELVKQRFEENREEILSTEVNDDDLDQNKDFLKELLAESPSLLKDVPEISNKRVTFKETSADFSSLTERNCSVRQQTKTSQKKSCLKHRKATSPPAECPMWKTV